MSFRTHYDNLHITQDATQETIRQAYRRLSKQYHPDINPSPNAHQIMQLINQAYSVLSDPQQRAEHDRWIEQQKQRHQYQTMITLSSKQQTQSNITPTPTHPQNRSTIWMICATILALLLLGWQIIYLIQQKKQPSTHPALSNISTPYTRPLTAPNGNPWPAESGYIPGYPITYGQQHHKLHIDNVFNTSDVYAELTLTDSQQILRTLFIKERSHFLLNKLNAGSYTIRYRQLDSGKEILSEPIHIHARPSTHTVYLKRSSPPKY